MSDELIMKIDKAHDVVSELCHGKRKWVMSIPARPDDDPDLIIGAALRASRMEIISLRSRVEELWQQVKFSDDYIRGINNEFATMRDRATTAERRAKELAEALKKIRRYQRKFDVNLQSTAYVMSKIAAEALSKIESGEGGAG